MSKEKMSTEFEAGRLSAFRDAAELLRKALELLADGMEAAPSMAVRPVDPHEIRHPLTERVENLESDILLLRERLAKGGL